MNKLKQMRQQAVVALIEEKIIDTQEKLKEELEASGFTVTQATVSRDIKELGLIKTLCGGGYRYSVNLRPAHKLTPMEQLHSTLSSLAVGADYAGNTVVIRCHTGMAQAVCARLDEAKLPQVVGTLAGDDTIFVLVRTADEAAQLSAAFGDDIR